MLLESKVSLLRSDVLLSNSLTTHLVAEALVKYVNLGVTLGAVNLPEVNLRSLTLEEPNHARVRYLFFYIPCERLY